MGCRCFGTENYDSKSLYHVGQSWNGTRVRTPPSAHLARPRKGASRSWRQHLLDISPSGNEATLCLRRVPGRSAMAGDCPNGSLPAMVAAHAGNNAFKPGQQPRFNRAARGFPFSQTCSVGPPLPARNQCRQACALLDLSDHANRRAMRTAAPSIACATCLNGLNRADKPSISISED